MTDILLEKIQKEYKSIQKDMPYLTDDSQDIFIGWLEALDFVENLIKNGDNK